MPSWMCPVCRERLALSEDGRRWECPSGHSFDVAREGYVNLLLPHRMHSRQPGDSSEMISARRRFLRTGAYDPMSLALADVIAGSCPATVLDVGCGEGRHTRFVSAPVVQGVDVAKVAVAAAARRSESGWYAVASAAELPVPDRAVDVAMVVFSPVIPAELARVVRPGGRVVIAHPGPSHLDSLRALVYPDVRPHQPHGPIGDSDSRFRVHSREVITFPVVISSAQELRDLYAMTPYRWHAPRDIDDRLTAAAAKPTTLSAEIIVSQYERRP